MSATTRKPAAKPRSVAARKPAATAIDREKLRAALRRLDDEQVLDMLDDAIDLLPPAALVKLVSPHLNVKRLRPDARGPRSLLAEARAFDTASRAGKYYESFNVNSRTFMDSSAGTRAFIADCRRLLDRCVAHAANGDAAETCEAIDLVLGVLRHVDECLDDIVFFAEEGGAWQVGVDWLKVMPAWFACLSKTTEPDEYARRVVEAVDAFDGAHRSKHLAAARRLGTPSQRRALGRG